MQILIQDDIDDNIDIIPNHCMLLTYSEIDRIIAALQQLKNEYSNDYAEKNNKEQMDNPNTFHHDNASDKGRMPDKPPESIPGYIYVLKCNEFYKIGKSKSLNSRFRRYSTENPYQMDVIFIAFVSDYHLIEERLLGRLAYKKHRGEWHIFDAEDLCLIKKILLQAGAMFVDGKSKL